MEIQKKNHSELQIIYSNEKGEVNVKEEFFIYNKMNYELLGLYIFPIQSQLIFYKSDWINLFKYILNI